jgi:hypothetical protein
MNAEQPNATQPQPNNGHDAKGRFTPGNPGGPGNPFGRKVAAFRTAMIKRVTQEKFDQAVDTLTEMAIKGNAQAQKLFFTYIVGKAVQTVDPDRMDIDEWNVYRDAVPMKAEAATVMQAGDPQLQLDYLRLMRPIITEIMREEVFKMFNETPEQREAREEAEAKEAEEFLNRPVNLPEGWGPDGRPIEGVGAPRPVTRRRGAKPKVQPPPSPYGDSGARPPSPHGTPPSPYGDRGQTSPLPAGEGPGVRGSDRMPAGTTDRGARGESPSPHGDFGPPPSLNGEKQTAPPGDGRFPPSSNGEFR